MTVQTPKYQNWFSTGNLITIIFGVVTATGMFFVMDARSQANSNYILEIKTDIKDIREDVSILEKEQARSDERFGSILGLLERIDTRLQRIEANR